MTTKRKTEGRIVLSRDDADRLLKVLAEAVKFFPDGKPEYIGDRCRECYADLAEQYAAAGYDVAELRGDGR